VVALYALYGAGEDAEVRAARWIHAVGANDPSFARIRKLEIRNFIGVGIGVYDAHDFVAEDKDVHHGINGLWIRLGSNPGSPS